MLRIFALEKYNSSNFSSQLVGSISKILTKKSDENSTNLYFCKDKNSRELAISSLKGIFIAVFNVEIRGQFLPFFKVVVKYLTIHGIFEANDKGEKL